METYQFYIFAAAMIFMLLVYLIILALIGALL